MRSITATCDRALSCWNLALSRARIKGRATSTIQTATVQNSPITNKRWWRCVLMVHHTIIPGDESVCRCRLYANPCIFHFVTKHECDHHQTVMVDDAVNRIENLLKSRRHANPAFRFVVECALKVPYLWSNVNACWCHSHQAGSPCCCKRNFELFLFTLVLQMISFLDSWWGCTIH